MTVTIPESHRDLLERPIVVSLSTVMPDGQPQSTPIWTTMDGEHIIVNTARGRQKDRNLSLRSKATILIIDPEDDYHWIEIRGEVDEVSEVGAVDMINRLSLKYRGDAQYYKTPEAAQRETRVTFRIKPTHVNTSRS